MRARELINFDGTPGKYNSITDVDDVEVGHSTIINGNGKLIVGKGPVRTGVTVIFPRGKSNAHLPVFAAYDVLNGNGENTIETLKLNCQKHAKSIGFEISFKQSNIEGEIVTLIQTAKNEFDGIIINAAGYTHTSVSILDALLATKLPVIEIHISNIYAREEYRQKSLISKAAKGIICGFGINGYIMALDAMKKHFN